MHILVFFQYYHTPDCPSSGRHYTFFKYLAEQGHRVTVLSTRVWYDKRITNEYEWTPPGVEVHMLNVPYANRMNARQRILSYLRYTAGAYLKGLKIDQPDVAWGISVPLTAAWAADRVARKRNIPWVFEVRDLWPEFPIQMGAIRNKTVQRRLQAMEYRLYDHADHIVTLSTDMEDHVIRCGIDRGKVTTLMNGTDFDQIDRFDVDDLMRLRREHGLGDRKVILYAGSFGRANDMPTLLAAARRLQHRDDFVFVFMGHGYDAPTIRKAADEQSNVYMLPTQARAQAMAWYKLADISLISFIDRPVLAVNSPTKFYDSLGAGTPIIVTNPGWTKAFVETHQCGWYTPPSDPEQLAVCLESVLNDPAGLEQTGRRAEVVARQMFDRLELAQRMEHILHQAAAAHGS